VRESVFFRGDSPGLVLRDRIDNCGVGDLTAADADGGNLRLVHSSVRENSAVGPNVFFNASDESEMLAAPIAGGTPVSVGLPAALEASLPFPNATGTAIARTSDGSAGYGLSPRSLILVELPSGEMPTVSDGATDLSGIFLWSPRGGRLAFTHQPLGATTISLAVVAADGTSRTEISANSLIEPPAFSPDDSWLAYAEPDSSGGTRLMTHSFIDGSDVALGVLPVADSHTFLFSGDSANVVAWTFTPPSNNASVYGATAGVAGSLQFLTADVDTPADAAAITAAGGHVALPIGVGMLEVLPITGGAPVALAGSNPQFESGVSQPHLLVSGPSPNELGVAAVDGTAATFQMTTDTVFLASWLGPAAVYATAASYQDPMTLSALSSGGTVSTQLAKGAGSYAWAPIAAPTRLFYARAASSADGPTGLWIVELPH
jgi:hypothetical protein